MGGVPEPGCDLVGAVATGEGPQQHWGGARRCSPLKMRFIQPIRFGPPALQQAGRRHMAGSEDVPRGGSIRAYSARSAAMGSTRTARSVGAREPPAVMARMRRATPANVAASSGRMLASSASMARPPA